MNETTGLFENETDFDQWSYLVQLLGPQRQPWNTLIPLTCVYLVLVILGIFGNLSVCFVIYRIPSMRSATNYYLFSLAIADLLILLLGKSNSKMVNNSIYVQNRFATYIISWMKVVQINVICKFLMKPEAPHCISFWFTIKHTYSIYIKHIFHWG